MRQRHVQTSTVPSAAAASSSSSASYAPEEDEPFSFSTIGTANPTASSAAPDDNNEPSSSATATANPTASSAAAAAANEEEAMRAKALGLEALQGGDYDRAVRLLGISNRLLPNADTRGLLNAALAGQARMDSGRASAHRTAAAAAPPWSQHQAFGRFMIKVDACMDRVWHYLPPPARDAINRYIHPSTRKPLAYVSVLILSAALYRFVLRGPPLAFGRLPGDIYYNSGNMVVSAPLLSCFLASMAFNQLARLFQQQGR